MPARPGSRRPAAPTAWVWTIDGTRLVGTGIGSDEGIAISYRSGSNTGIALLGKEPWGYGLVWTYMGGTDLGTERWTRR